MGRIALIALELLVLSALVVFTRCANHREVFFGGAIYFTDSDCYARMTRVRICAEHPGRVIRHQDFENFPLGTTPHTTAPLDYLILGLSIFLKPFTAHALDLGGALISPILALLGSWFLWWWSRRMKFRYRWMMLILYAISPILVHGTELGRPDHQSLSILLVTIGVCADWRVHSAPSRNWSVLSGIAWGLAIWVSLYEPLVLLLLVVALELLQHRQSLFGGERRVGWMVFAASLALALVVEQRLPSLTVSRSEQIFLNWSQSIGELRHVSPIDPAWFAWVGYLIALVPLLILAAVRMGKSIGKSMSVPGFVLGLLVTTYLLTIWQARWSYFFVLVFALALPRLLAPIESRTAVWLAFALSLLPVLREWDERLWPNETEYGRRVERRNELAQLRELATVIQSPGVRPFLAPWWLSPAIAYWSGQPATAGSSHESLQGIADSARFYLTEDWQSALEIMRKRRVAWIFAYDSDRVAENSSTILGQPIPRGGQSLCFILDRAPTRAPAGLNLAAQTNAVKLYHGTELQ
ncbi:MAG TPA: hypothetical protein VE758_06440 [Chthoniobacterales bacterium]|nr:hypothetical protein [Chthoniobacterales bacterium]